MVRVSTTASSSASLGTWDGSGVLVLMSFFEIAMNDCTEIFINKLS